MSKKKFDCVEVKLRIQKEFSKKTKKMTEKEILNFAEVQASTGQFSYLF